MALKPSRMFTASRHSKLDVSGSEPQQCKCHGLEQPVIEAVIAVPFAP